MSPPSSYERAHKGFRALHRSPIRSWKIDDTRANEAGQQGEARPAT
jgi:hypothetical protein